MTDATNNKIQAQSIKTQAQSILSPNLIGALLVMGGTILFSSKTIMVKYAYQYDVTPLALQTLR